MNARMVVSREPSGITWLKMDDPEGHNAFSHDFVQEFLAALQDVEKEDLTKVLVLQGREDVFCGGAQKQALL
ncbi:MAG TPA: enoyl-CoA hydratase-related protein, partial [Spirochaetia bacterium]|nr:enoyl-CoA hydratase-related protein [Spirochaetia bacterium]